MKHWDIFCKIVDNFGDIGVCWRLSQQLQREHGLQIRLFIDDLAIAQRIIPTLKSQLAEQTINQITICPWPCEPINTRPAAHVVLETFSCGLPPQYLAQLPASTVWVNLEYLSAENWVEDFHKQHSSFGADKPKRYFFYPGFTLKTGGLIREQGAVANVRPELVEGCLNVSLFCYPTAPITQLLTALQANKHAVVLHVPASTILPHIAHFFGLDSLSVGQTMTRENLSVQVLPFLSQADYDALLRACDLNFVRGEDSWVRAIWAAKPLIWQPYVQADDVSLDKLDAFLSLFYADFAQQTLVQQAHLCWSTGQGEAEALNEILQHLPAMQAHTQVQAVKLASQADLATQLVDFCNNL